MSNAGPCPNCGTGQLDAVEVLRFGELVRCDRCQLMLYLDGRGIGHDVSADDVRFLREWNASPQRLPRQEMETIAAIGPYVVRDLRGVAAVRAPSRVVLEAETIEPVLVACEPRAPLGRPGVILASRVVRVEATMFALPLAVRDAALSDAPLLFRTVSSGRFLRLRKGALFVEEEGIVGSDVVLCWRGDVRNGTYEQALEGAPTVGHADARTVAVDLDDDALEFFSR